MNYFLSLFYPSFSSSIPEKSKINHPKITIKLYMYIIKNIRLRSFHLKSHLMSSQFLSKIDKPSLANSLSDGFTISPSILPRLGRRYIK